MCAIFLSHFVFAVFWRTLVAFGFVFHHDWFCRLYIVMLLSALSFAGPKEMQNLQSCKYEIVLPCQDYKIKVDGYDEGIIYYYYFKDGGVIIITEGSLLEFDFETLEPLACSLKTAIGMIGEKYWRRDNVGGKVRAYYVNVPENSKKSYDASLNSIILSRQESWSKGPRRTSPARRHF